MGNKQMASFAAARTGGDGFMQPKNANRSVVARANAAINNNLEIEARTIPGLSGEQIQSLLDLLKNQNHGQPERMTGENFNNMWIIDSGATNHMTGDREQFSSIRNIPNVDIGLPHGDQIIATAQGVVPLDHNILLNNVLYVPQFSCNLISITQLMDEGLYYVHLTRNLCVIQDLSTKMLIGVAKRRGRLYYFLPGPPASVMHVGIHSDTHLWHARLGHPSWEVQKLLSPAIGIFKETMNNACDICQRAKQTRSHFPLSMNNANNCFDLIHCDLWGPYRQVSSCGASYFLTIVDDYSRAVWIYLLVDKKSVMRTLLQFFAYVQRFFAKQVKTFRSDNGTEFTCMRDYFLDNGIVFQTSCAGTPQQNGRAERKHRHILNIARALRFQGHLPMEFWGECVLTAGYLLNRTPSRVLNGKTPYEMLHGVTPSYDHLRILGSLCYASKRHKDGKFDDRSQRCVFLGYPNGKKAWILYNLETKTFLISRDVVFFEGKHWMSALDTLDVGRWRCTPNSVV